VRGRGPARWRALSFVMAPCTLAIAGPAAACGGVEDKFKVVAVAPGAADEWPLGSYLCVDDEVRLELGEYLILRNDKDIMLRLRGPGRRKIAIAERRPATVWGTIRNVLDPRFWGLENKQKAAVRFAGDKADIGKFA
jgi:hypothetical protein